MYIFNLAIEFKDIFRDYHPDNPKNANLRAITLTLDQMEYIEDPKEFLIKGFAQYCAHVLQNVGELLGSHPLIKILESIEKVLGYVKKYQAGSKEKNKIVNDMKNVIIKVHSEFKMEKKGRSKGGIFSLFS